MSRRGKLSARSNRAFAVLLGLSLTTAALSVVVVQQTERTFVHGPVEDVTASMLTNLRADDFGARPI
jgi:hypothetical protein